MVTNAPMLITFTLYIVAMLAIGVIAYFATNNFDDYILGGRSLGRLVTALSAGASDMSGWLLMGLPGAIFLVGLSDSWIAVGLLLGAYLNWLLVAGRLRVFTEVNDNALTLPDYFTSRFEDKSQVLRLFSAIIILIFFTIYCASGVVAGARLFESIFHVTYAHAIWLGAIATIAYTFIGGFLAVSWTDTVQASLMFFALILTPLIVIYSLGGFDASIAIIKAQNVSYLNFFQGVKPMLLVSLLGWGLGYFGQPHILARFMAADSHHTIVGARRISMTWMFLCLLGAVSVGFFGIAYFQQNMQLAGPVLNNPERVFIELSKVLFNPWIAGVLLSAILAAVMSTLSCQLLVCASAMTEDLYKGFFRKQAGQKELVWVGRLMVLIIALIAIFLASNPNNRVLGLVSYAWAGFGAAFGPVILFSLYWSKMTRNSALSGMLVGALTVLIWKPYLWFGLYEIIPGFVFSSLAIIITSIIDKKPSHLIQTRFKRARHMFYER